MPPLEPFLVGGLLLFRLFGLVFAVLGAVNLFRPREMTAYAFRQHSGGAVDGRIEPTPTRLLVTLITGGITVVVGLGLAFGALEP